MRTTDKNVRPSLPGTFTELVALMPPQAITDAVHHENTVDMIDRLMAGGGRPRR